jgi:beta-lactamase regulating signal transducer with metallopeptidase domain
MIAAAATAGISFIAPLDSARAVAAVYTVSLLATLPILFAGIAALLMRRASAEGRVLVWRSALVVLLLMFVGRQLPLHSMAWVVPSSLAAPLVALGRVQVTANAIHALGAASPEAADGMGLVGLVFSIYVAGVGIVLLPTVAASMRLRLIARRGRALGGAWRGALDEQCARLSIGREVRLVVSRETTVPMTWGFLRPVIVIPNSALGWHGEQRRMVLMHELSHVRAADWAFNLVGRAVCALYWFHPGAWWLARGLREDCELACDDRVIASGVRRSDYAELLVGAADRFLGSEPALALSRRGGLRARLSAVLDARHDVRPLRRAWVTTAALGTIAIAGPMSAVQLAPTRDVLTTLMSDARWESRAYAVIGLAARADSVAVARSAAERDPNPRVRAWARYALGQRDGAADLRSILNR